MNPQDDPEERIRQLEQSGVDRARASELGQTHQRPDYGYVPSAAGYFPPPPGAAPPPVPYPEQYPPPYPAMSAGDATFPGVPPSTGSPRAVVIVSVMVATFALVVAGGVTLFLMTRSPDRPSISGGGATLSERPDDPPSSGGPATFPSEVPSTDVLAPGSNVSIAGMGNDKTLACNDNVVSISGFENTIVLTGRCQSVSVSGKDNVVTVDEAGVIGVSGFDNRVVFHVGEPEVTKSGFGNTVDRG